MFQDLFAIEHYSFLLSQLVRRDFKTKYRGSFLGVLWSVLNPLLNMLVLSIVFSQIFKQVENYMLYVLSGITLFTYFNESTQQGLNSIVWNFGLVSKVNVPKVIFPISKTLSSSISLFITTLVFLILSWFAGVAPTIYYLLIPVVLILLILFATGMSFILATLEVFFRDTQHLYGVICTIWMYATPVLYPFETTIPEAFQPIFRINPMFQILSFFRDVAFYGQMPSATTILASAAWAIGVFLFGLWFFHKKQDNFIYYT